MAMCRPMSKWLQDYIIHGELKWHMYEQVSWPGPGVKSVEGSLADNAIYQTTVYSYLIYI